MRLGVRDECRLAAFRVASVAIVLVAALFHSPVGANESSPGSSGTSVLSCVNPASGVRFSLPLNLAANRVGPFRAAATKRRISWHDTRRGGYYSFDRRTGRLTVVFPSSTGGFSLHDNCVLLPSRPPSTHSAKR